MDEQESDDGSDTTSTTNVLGYESGATCHPGGICKCSDPTIYHGNGCTISGHSSHANTNQYRPIPGNLPLLHCDTRNLFSGQTLDATVQVYRGSPSTLHFDATPTFPRSIQEGDHLSVEGQIRQILTIKDVDGIVGNGALVITVDYPFLDTSEYTTHSHIIPAMTSVQRVGGPERDDDNKGRHGNIARCLVADIRPLSDETTFCEDNAERPHCGRATVSGSGPWLNRIVTFGGRLTDPNDHDSDSNLNERVPGILSSVHEVDIGDRLRIITTGNSVNGVAPIWETRTIDSITYEHTPMGIIPSEKVITGVTVSFGYSAPHDMKPVFVDTTGTTESTVCSGRGLCNENTGVCQCFRGYSWSDCSSQEVLQM